MTGKRHYITNEQAEDILLKLYLGDLLRLRGKFGILNPGVRVDVNSFTITDDNNKTVSTYELCGSRYHKINNIIANPQQTPPVPPPKPDHLRYKPPVPPPKPDHLRYKPPVPPPKPPVVPVIPEIAIPKEILPEIPEIVISKETVGHLIETKRNRATYRMILSDKSTINVTLDGPIFHYVNGTLCSNVERFLDSGEQTVRNMSKFFVKNNTSLYKQQFKEVYGEQIIPPDFKKMCSYVYRKLTTAQRIDPDLYIRWW